MKMATEAAMKITASTGNEYFSNACTRLWPKKANPVCNSTMMIRPTSGPKPNRVDSANAPLMLLVANHPTPAATDISTAGTALPLKPNAIRPSTICGTPCSGSRADSRKWAMAPSPVPIAMPTTACQKFIPNARTASIPTNIVANSRLGDVHVQNS